MLLFYDEIELAASECRELWRIGRIAVQVLCLSKPAANSRGFAQILTAHQRGIAITIGASWRALSNRKIAISGRSMCRTVRNAIMMKTVMCVDLRFLIGKGMSCEAESIEPLAI